MENPQPVFYDEQQRRWHRTRRVLEISGAILTLLLFTFFFTAIQKADLPQLLLPETKPALHAIRDRHRDKTSKRRPGSRRRVASLGKVPENYEPLRAGFYVSWDRTSLASLEDHYRSLDLLIPEALHVITADGRINQENDPALQSWLSSSGVEIPMMPLVNNFDGKDWRGLELGELLTHAEDRQRLENALAGIVSGRAGLVVDFEEVPDGTQPRFRDFVQEMAAALHQKKLKLMVTLPAADSSYDYAFLAKQSDAIILMNYDQHWANSKPGPIAAQDWFQRNLDVTLRKAPRDKVIVAIANYAYDWPEHRRGAAATPAESISFEEAVVTAQESGATVEFDSDLLNPHFNYADDEDHTRHVWMLDAVAAYNQIHACSRAGVRGTALWRLGSEDNSLWSIWESDRPTDEAARSKLGEIPPGYDLILEGDGDIWRIAATPQRGQRTFRYEKAADLITDESFSSYPSSYRIDQMGAVKGKIALTFDDGPDPRYTPRVLDILKEKRAPATFFVTGLAANSSPGLLRRIYREGHEIGNHTYTHPHLDQVSKGQLGIELNLTQRLFESTLGVKTLLFRPPYGIDHQPETADEVRLLPFIQDLGYLIVGARIDPHDWGEEGGQPPPSTRDIVRRVLDQAQSGSGNVVLLHDGGGNRRSTVEALPDVIDGLRAKGFELVGASALLGQTRSDVMPRLNSNEWWQARADFVIFDLYHWFRLSIAYLFVAGIVLISARALIIGLLALLEKRRPIPAAPSGFRPRVSVLIPAYNEEEVIVESVRAAVDSNYPNFEVIVVDDGSTDRTSELLHEGFRDDPRVRMIRQANQGKSAALTRALTEATGEIVATIDADTSIDREALGKLARHFADPGVGAVAGNAKVANRHGWLARWQALEYITSQNLEKRAFDLLNCITVVPGAIGALRPEAIREVGGFPSDTLAEDTDLTLAIRRRRWRIAYDDRAIGRTQAPETAGTLVRQRFRWTFGTLQAVWKHRDTLGRPRYGTLGSVALPNLFLFQILLPLFSPVIDLMFVSSLALWGLAQIHVARLPLLWTPEDIQRSFIFFVAFMFIDFLTCVVAFALEKSEDWSLLIPLLIQRFYYRQMMYFVLFRALVWAVQGRRIGWGAVPTSKPTTAVKTA